FGKDAAVGEELAQPDRHVWTCQKRGERPDGNVVERLVRRLPDLRIGILEEMHANRELFVGARREPALCGQQSHVTCDFSALEELQQPTGAHGAVGVLAAGSTGAVGAVSSVVGAGAAAGAAGPAAGGTGGVTVRRPWVAK